MPSRSVSARGSQINIYGIDKKARDEFKRICGDLGYHVNDVFQEIVEAVVQAGNAEPLKRFFKVMQEYEDAK
jgi:hypothetical protein